MNDEHKLKEMLDHVPEPIKSCDYVFVLSYDIIYDKPKYNGYDVFYEPALDKDTAIFCSREDYLMAYGMLIIKDALNEPI